MPSLGQLKKLKNPTLKDGAYGRSPKKYKISQSNIFIQSPRVTYPLLGYCTSVAETVPESKRASVQTRTVTLLSERFLLRSRTSLLYFYFYFAAQWSTRGLFTLYRSVSVTLRFTIRYSVNITFDNHEVLILILIHRVKAKELVG